MSVKIKNISITAFRGIQEAISLELNERSVVIYGDNGTGKSSIADALEFFLYKKVGHLSGIEIDLREALRNQYSKNDIPTSVNIDFNPNDLSSTITINEKSAKNWNSYKTTADSFEKYLNASERENIILRYQNLRNFIDSSKTDKLNNLSEIIGFGEVTKVKNTLRKVVNSIKGEIKSKNYEGQINTQKNTIKDKLNAIINTEDNLLTQINKLFSEKGLSYQLTTFADIDTLLQKLNNPQYSENLLELQNLKSCQDFLSTLKSELGLINNAYKAYYDEYSILEKDTQSILNSFMKEFLTIGQDVLKNKYHKNETCPFCLQPKNKTDLLNELVIRLDEIEKALSVKRGFDKAKQELSDIVSERISRLTVFLKSEVINKANNNDIKMYLVALNKKMELISQQLDQKILRGDHLLPPQDLELRVLEVECEDLTKKIILLEESFKNDVKMILYEKISAAKDAFLKIVEFNKEKSQLEQQKASLEVIYTEFIRKQQIELQNFIDSISDKINYFYQYMNPGEPFKDIKIVPYLDEDDMTGLTIEYSFANTTVSSPKQYFSESHLNCFGLAFFLASTIEFNKVNRYLIFDDVISSFDTTHRKRFADLILEQFKEWQIIILTHEFEWYQIVRSLVKNKNWVVQELKWNDDKGTYIDQDQGELKAIIENSIKKGELSNLGNNIRIYLEQFLKTLCFNLEVKLKYLPNERNEQRMLNELLCELKAKIKLSSSELYQKVAIVDKILSSTILTNLLSHDNSFHPTLGDLTSFWVDICEFEQLFLCNNTTCKHSMLSMKFYDNVTKKIRCGCGELIYDWK